MSKENPDRFNLSVPKYSLRRFLPVFFNLLFAFNLLVVFAGGNRTAQVFSDPHNSLSSGSVTYSGFHNPIRHNSINLILENTLETEENMQSQTDFFDFHDMFAYNIHQPIVSQLGECMSNLPSLFFQRKDNVPLFVLFHSWKNHFA